MNQEMLKQRTQQFALRIIKLVNALPKTKTIADRNIGNQLFKSGTSTAANYRAVCRARSKAEFIAKLGIVEEEADESAFWLEIIIKSNLMKSELVTNILIEANELVAIMVASRKSAKRNQ